eukprot:RCo043278
MSLLFTPVKLRSVELANRIVVPPMCQYSATEGIAGDWHLMHLGKLAVSGVGLIIVEATAVNMTGRVSPKDLALCSDEQEAALARVVEFCRKQGLVKMGIQLNHAGRKASTSVPFLQGPVQLCAEKGGWPTEAPSPIPFVATDPPPRELSEPDMNRIKADFVAAAVRASRAGFEVLELHGAHGYLLNEFLSPLCNTRSDQYRA